MLNYVVVVVTITVYLSGRIQRVLYMSENLFFSNKCMYESVPNVVCCTVDIFTAHKILRYTLRVSLRACLGI